MKTKGFFIKFGKVYYELPNLNIFQRNKIRLFCKLHNQIYGTKLEFVYEKGIKVYLIDNKRKDIKLAKYYIRKIYRDTFMNIFAENWMKERFIFSDKNINELLNKIKDGTT